MEVTTVLVVPVDGIDVTYIPAAELYEAGYTGLRDFDVVKANGSWYELQGFDKKTGLWWVEKIEVPQEDDAGQGMESVGEGSSEGPGRDAERTPGE